MSTRGEIIHARSIVERTKTLRYLDIKILEPGEVIHPNANEEWKIKSGYIVHITGTASQLVLFKREPKTVIYTPLIEVPSAQANINISLNPMTNTVITEERSTDTKEIPIQQNIEIGFTGGTASKATLIVEVTKLHPDTGAKLA